eukprot:GEMP01028679.1.p1 GENE.GEMP01028679.1~~GEMP01028679.1.p1  ORF type:complete len:579 (+),score=111.32 GEMP01028679.1:80-1816(+)
MTLCSQATSRWTRKLEDYFILTLWTVAIWCLANTQSWNNFSKNTVQKHPWTPPKVASAESWCHVTEQGRKYCAPHADGWLSDEEFRGMHIVRREGVNSFSIFLHGKKTDVPIRFTPTSLQNFRRELEYLLQIPPREPLQLDIGIFTFLGRHATEEDFASAPALAVYEGGAFMWPPVSIGHNHTLHDVVVEGKTVVLTTLSLKPALFKIRNVLASDEPENFVKLAQDRLVKSATVVETTSLDNEDHAEFSARYRTSSQAWLNNNDDVRVEEFRERASQIMRVEQENLEDLQVLRYRPSEQYNAHEDPIDLKLYPNQPGIWRDEHYGYNKRMATVFTYLNTVENGGETAFPRAGRISEPEGEDWLSRCDDHFKVKAVKGTGVMWYNVLPTGELDPSSIHMGCKPEDTSVKWSANLWVRPKRWKRSKAYPNHPVLKRLDLIRPELPAQEDPYIYESFTLVVRNTLNVDLVLSYVPDPSGFTYTINAGERYDIYTFRGHEWLVTANGRTRKLIIHKSLIDIGVVVEEATESEEDETDPPHRIILQVDETFFPDVVDDVDPAQNDASTSKSVEASDSTSRTEL